MSSISVFRSAHILGAPGEFHHPGLGLGLGTGVVKFSGSAHILCQLTLPTVWHPLNTPNELVASFVYEACCMADCVLRILGKFPVVHQEWARCLTRLFWRKTIVHSYTLRYARDSVQLADFCVCHSSQIRFKMEVAITTVVAFGNAAFAHLEFHGRIITIPVRLWSITRRNI